MDALPPHLSQVMTGLGSSHYLPSSFKVDSRLHLRISWGIKDNGQGINIQGATLAVCKATAGKPPTPRSDIPGLEFWLLYSLAFTLRVNLSASASPGQQHLSHRYPKKKRPNSELGPSRCSVKRCSVKRLPLLPPWPRRKNPGDSPT